MVEEQPGAAEGLHDATLHLVLGRRTT
jgi:hypothetical protein